MPLVVNADKANFRISGADFEPWRDEAWQRAGTEERRQYWDKVGELAFHEKKKELRRGIDIHGKRLKPIKYRRPDGSTGPPLSPHQPNSRFQRNLSWANGANGCTVFWQGGWSRIVGAHASGYGNLPVRDVVGLTVASQARVKEGARLWWSNRHGVIRWKPGPKPTGGGATGPAMPTPRRPQPAPTIRPPIAARPATERELIRKYPYLSRYLRPDPFAKRRPARP